MERTKIYFVSDAHFGVDSGLSSEVRENLFVEWLDSIKSDASELYLLGDIFDFWFEYTYVVPRGFVTVLAKLRELSNAGVKIKYFTGNHDMWVFDYLPKEIDLVLANDFGKQSKNDRVIRGTLMIEDGIAKIRVPKGQGNVMISSTIGSYCVAVVPGGRGPLKAGDKIKGYLI